MNQTYHITGMTCNGCKAQVTKQLQEVSGVSEVIVDLATGEAALVMASHIPLKQLRASLSSKYEISPKVETQTVLEREVVSETQEKSVTQQLYPLFLILGYITVAALLLNRKEGNVSSFMLDFMGLFYIVFSFFKILGLKGFPQSFKMYDPLAKILPIYGWIYPFIETALGLCFLMRFEITIALVATIIILGMTTIGVAKTLLDKKTIQCACLGTVLKLPMTKATIIENTIMLFMAAWMLFLYYSKG